jgi:iron-sulfur cluster assembly protein
MISLTDIAAKKVQQQILRRGKGLGIRIGVKTTGCSGLSYVLEFVDYEIPEDQHIECKDCTIYIDPKALPYINGMTIDYVRNGLNEGFDFKNPNEKNRCGCGSSFRI